MSFPEIAESWHPIRVAAVAGRGVATCFERLGASWREHGEYRIREYFAEYEIPPAGVTDMHTQEEH